MRIGAHAARTPSKNDGAEETTSNRSCWWLPLPISWALIVLVGVLALLALMNLAFHQEQSALSDHPRLQPKPETFSPTGVAKAFQLDTSSSGCYIADSSTSPCLVLCESISSNFYEKLQHLVYNNQECSYMELTVKSSFVGGYGLTKGWLPTDIQLSKLHLESCPQIYYIADDAFEGPQFWSLTSLMLTDLEVTHIFKAMLNSISDITELTLSQLQHLRHMEAGSLDSLPNLNSLQIIQSLNSSNVGILRNITENQQQTTLAIIDYSSNVLRTVKREYFAGARLTKSIYLRNSHIEYIEDDTFGGNMQVVQLFLDGNKLTTLQEGAIRFQDLQQFAVYLTQNPWHCDCSLSWLLNYTDQINDNPTCATPELFEGVALKDLKENQNYMRWCFGAHRTTTEFPSIDSTIVPTTSISFINGTASRSPTTTPPTIETHTPVPTITWTQIGDSTTSPETEIMQPTTESPSKDDCHFKNFDEHHVAGIGWDEIDVSSIAVEDLNEITIMITVAQSFRLGHVSWRGNEEDTCSMIGPITSPFIRVSDLKSEGLYTICALGQLDRKPSIQNCIAHKMLTPYDSLAWLTNNERVAVIVGVTIVLTASVVISGLTALIVLRRHPTWISKNVVVVRDKPVVVPPAKKPTDVATSPSWVPPPRLPTPPDPPPRRRSSASYVTVKEPTPVQFVAWHLNKTCRRVVRMFERTEPFSSVGTWRRPSLWSSTSSQTLYTSPRESVSGADCDALSVSTIDTTASKEAGQTYVTLT